VGEARCVAAPGRNLLPVREQVTAALERAVLADHLRAVLARHRIGTVLDVGAHAGEYATFLRGIGYDGAIVSYEPVRETFERLAAASVADEGWTAHRLALGDRDGSATIHVARSSDFSSFRRFSDYGSATFATAARVERREAVESRRLDGVLDQHVRDAATPILLKLDTQGWDMQVLEGAGGILDHVAALHLRPFPWSQASGSPGCAARRSRGACQRRTPRLLASRARVFQRFADLSERAAGTRTRIDAHEVAGQFRNEARSVRISPRAAAARRRTPG
jgi:FkbM family methyltransferase